MINSNHHNLNNHFKMTAPKTPTKASMQLSTSNMEQLDSENTAVADTPKASKLNLNDNAQTKVKTLTNEDQDDAKSDATVSL